MMSSSGGGSGSGCGGDEKVMVISDTKGSKAQKQLDFYPPLRSRSGPREVSTGGGWLEG